MKNSNHKILAIDYGTKIIGVAISNDKLNMALPYCQIKNDKNMFNKLIAIILDENIKTIVIGYPFMQNYVSQRHQLILEFKNQLDKQLNNNDKIIEFFNEAYSTKQSYNSLSSFNINHKQIKQKKDMISATIILENYLKSKINIKD